MKVLARSMRFLTIGIVLFAFAALAGDPIETSRVPVSGDVEAIVTCLDSVTAYVLSILRDDTLLIHTLDIPTGKILATSDTAVLLGPRRTHAADVNHFRLDPSGFPACGRLYVGNYPAEASSVDVYDTAKVGEKGLKPIATVPDILRPTDVKFNDFDTSQRGLAKTALVYATSWATDSLVVIDPETNTIAERIPLKGCQSPNALVLDGQIAYVACRFNDVVAKVDLSTRQVVSVVQLNTAKERAPFDIAITRADDRVWTANPSTHTVSVIDGARSAPVKTVETCKPGVITVECLPVYIAATTDGLYVFVINVSDKSISVLCAATMEEVKKIPVSDIFDKTPGILAVTPNNRYLVFTVRGVGLRVWNISGLYDSPDIFKCPR